MEIIRRSECRVIKRHFVDYHEGTIQPATLRFTFELDSQGVPILTNPAARFNYDWCVKATKMVPELRDFDDIERRPMAIRCECGSELELYDPMTNECGCGRFFNGSGQALSHPSNWGKETGESFDDHGTQIL